MRKNWLKSTALIAGVASLSACEMAGDIPAEQRGTGEGTIELAEFPDRPYWGDTHLHTDQSIDAFGFGVRLGPDAALQFASGEEVTSTTGVKAQLARPLDFLVIADHSDSFNSMRALYDTPRVAVVALGGFFW